MPDDPPLLPRNCYQAAQVRRLFANRDNDGKLIIMSSQKLYYWRIQGLIPSAKFGGTYLYPKVGVDEMIRKANNL